MARARARANRQQNEIAGVIIAEWFRLLQSTDGADGPMDVGSLTAAFNQILDVPCEAIEDGIDTIKIVVPRPPQEGRRKIAGIPRQEQGFCYRIERGYLIRLRKIVEEVLTLNS